MIAQTHFLPEKNEHINAQKRLKFALFAIKRLNINKVGKKTQGCLPIWVIQVHVTLYQYAQNQTLCMSQYELSFKAMNFLFTLI